MIQQLRTVTELQELITVFSAAFESEYSVDASYLTAMLAHPSTLVLGAFEGSRIVGGLVACELMPIHGEKEFYVYDIAVHPDAQKRGIGRQLIEHLKGIARTEGVKTLFVEAESEDEGAVNFYRAIGGEEVAVNHFNFPTG